VEPLLAYDEERDVASLTQEGTAFMAHFVIQNTEPPPELPIGVLLVAANLIKVYWKIESVDLHDVVSGAAFNTDMPALEMPQAVQEIRRRLVEGLRNSDLWRNLRSQLPDL